MSEKFALNDKNTRAIRTAWAAGRKTVVIDGLTFNLSISSHHVNFQRTNVDTREKETVTRTERWIIAKPSDGRLVPLFNVVADSGSNFRS